jgi:hypothetical protein
MFERDTETAREVAPDGEPLQALNQLRSEFLPLVTGLPPELEPATLFLVHPQVEERHS